MTKIKNKNQTKTKEEKWCTTEDSSILLMVNCKTTWSKVLIETPNYFLLLPVCTHKNIWMTKYVKKSQPVFFFFLTAAEWSHPQGNFQAPPSIVPPRSSSYEEKCLAINYNTCIYKATDSP